MNQVKWGMISLAQARTRAVLLSDCAKPDFSLTVTVQFFALWHSSKTIT